MTIYAKQLGVMAAWAPFGYAYFCNGKQYSMKAIVNILCILTQRL